MAHLTAIVAQRFMSVGHSAVLTDGSAQRAICDCEKYAL